MDRVSAHRRKKIVNKKELPSSGLCPAQPQAKEGDARPKLPRKHFLGGRRQTTLSQSKSNVIAPLWPRHWLDLWHMLGGCMCMMFLITTFADDQIKLFWASDCTHTRTRYTPSPAVHFSSSVCTNQFIAVATGRKWGVGGELTHKAASRSPLETICLRAKSHLNMGVRAHNI